MPTRKPKLSAACTVCRHPERHRIEALRVAGATADVLADRFSVGRDAIYRHMVRHVSADVKAAIIADVPVSELMQKAAEESGSLLDYLKLIRRTTIGQMLGAASVNDRAGTAKLAGRALETLQEIARLTGELISAASVTNITNYTTIMASPAFLDLERMLAERLAPYPDARAAVLSGLEELEAVAATQKQPGNSPLVLEGTVAA